MTQSVQVAAVDPPEWLIPVVQSIAYIIVVYIKDVPVAVGHIDHSSDRTPGVFRDIAAGL
jgi:hypothetical protein